MKVISNLARYVKFGSVEVQPFENNFDDKESQELLAHKGFNQYVKNKDFTIEVDAVEEETEVNPKDYTAEELKEKFNVKQLKAFCKDLGITGYSNFNQDELVEAILA